MLSKSSDDNDSVLSSLSVAADGDDSEGNAVGAPLGSHLRLPSVPLEPEGASSGRRTTVGGSPRDAPDTRRRETLLADRLESLLESVEVG
jgi:hypothetical protein